MNELITLIFYAKVIIHELAIKVKQDCKETGGYFDEK